MIAIVIRHSGFVISSGPVVIRAQAAPHQTPLNPHDPPFPPPLFLLRLFAAIPHLALFGLIHFDRFDSP